MADLEPKTREEVYLGAIAEGGGDVPTPVTRKEVFYSAILGDIAVDDLPAPVTREEVYLKAIAENGGGGTTILSGTSIPTSEIGEDGQIYFLYEELEDSGLGWYARSDYLVKDTTTKLWNNWVKTNDTPSVAVRYHYQGWYGAIQVSTNADGVKHTNNTGNPAGSAVINGLTWYISTDTGWNSSAGTTEVPTHIDTVRAVEPNIEAVISRILAEANVSSAGDKVITNAYIKVNGAWQEIIGSSLPEDLLA